MFEWSVDAGLFKCAEKRIGVCFFQPLHVRHEGSRTYNSQKSLTDKTLLLLLSFVCQCIFIHPCLHPRVFSPAVALYPSLSVFFFFVFSPPCARLASPHVPVRLKVSSTRTGCQGESMNTWEHFVRWDITDGSASHWALNREAAQGFFFLFHYISS